MKKRSIVLLIFICIVSIIALTGLLVYAFKQQAQKDLEGSPKGTSTIDSGKQTDEGDTSPTPKGQPDDSGSITITPVPLSPSGDVTITPLPDINPLSPIVLGFAGDVNLDEDNPPAKKYDFENAGILGLLSQDLLDEMNLADIMMLNNEFSYSQRGIKASDKSFTFRANPDRVGILKDMGVDIVSLANNHALDYGTDALFDTFDTLDNAGIDYVGAGENLDRALEPIYYEVGGKKLAFLAASRVVFSMDWYASENSAGMIGTYDPTLILAAIKDAKENSDYVVIFVHWGIERENHPVDYQRNLAKQYIDAGADAVVGCHPHVMQGFEYYKNKPIAYSLGNFIFTSRSNKSGFLKLYLDPEGSVKMQLLPAVYSDTYTYLLTENQEKKDYYEYIKEISYNVSIDKDGFITETK